MKTGDLDNVFGMSGTEVIVIHSKVYYPPKLWCAGQKQGYAVIY